MKQMLSDGVTASVCFPFHRRSKTALQPCDMAGKGKVMKIGASGEVCDTYMRKMESKAG